MNATVFVYFKKGKKLIVLSITDAKLEHEQLIKKGYKHTATIDACTWIAYLFNGVKPENIVEYVKELANGSTA